MRTTSCGLRSARAATGQPLEHLAHWKQLMGRRPAARFHLARQAADVFDFDGCRDRSAHFFFSEPASTESFTALTLR